MTIWPVTRAAGGYEATDPLGRRMALLTQGGPVHAFGPGWSPLGVVSAFAPLHLLLLHHPDAGTQVWLLDDMLDWLGEWHAGIPGDDAGVAAIRAALPQPLQHALAASLTALRLQGLASAHPHVEGAIRGLSLLPRDALAPLLDALSRIALGETRVVALDDLGDAPLFHADEGMSFSLPLLRGLLPDSPLSAGHPDLAAATLARGSPLDGGMLVSQGGWRPMPGWTTHRFVSGETVLLLGLTASAKIPAHLYVPALDLAFVIRGPADPHLGTRLRAAYLAEAVRDVPRLSAALAHPDLHLPGDFTTGLTALHAATAPPGPMRVASAARPTMADAPHDASNASAPPELRAAVAEERAAEPARAADRESRVAWWMKLFAGGRDRPGRD